MNKVRTEDAATYGAAVAHDEDEKIIRLAIRILERQLAEVGVSDAAFTDPAAVKTFLRFNLARLEHEEFAVLFLNNQHKLIKYQSMFRGTIDGASVYPREVAKEALTCNAAAVIFAHNHPSGISEPSQADRAITNKLKEALSLFDIRVLDHFIVGETMYSFAEHGLI